MRESIHITHMRTAYNYANRSHCIKRKVGCIIVKGDRIISIGYNGTPPGWDNCCEGPDGRTMHDIVYHAEENAIGKLASSNESGVDAALYSTLEPCSYCAKQIVNAGIKEVYYSEDLPKMMEKGLDFLRRNHVAVHKITITQE